MKRPKFLPGDIVFVNDGAFDEVVRRVKYCEYRCGEWLYVLEGLRGSMLSEKFLESVHTKWPTLVK